ncbi:hypothetical protein [Streptomyces griseorubiginosus]|uniref:hypothetical protein n=1 Tax=Streptomyces griseorubiginosus TaxID=67304 RepID=UPI0036E32021
MTRRTRLLTLLVAVVLLGGVGTGAVQHAAHQQQADGPTLTAAAAFVLRAVDETSAATQEVRA